MNRKSGMKYLIGNWKSNKTIEEAREWIGVVKGAKLPRQPNLEVVLCPSFIHLSLFREVYPEMRLGLQTISPFPLGAYTGAVAAGMVFDLVRYVIVGHSERRRYFHELILPARLMKFFLAVGFFRQQRNIYVRLRRADVTNVISMSV